MRGSETVDPDFRPKNRSWAQPILIAAAGFVWALFPIPTMSAFVWAYLGLWLALALAKGRDWAWTEFRWPAGLALTVIASLCAPTALYIAEQGSALVQNAQLTDLGSVLKDRANNTGDLHIHPPVVQGDRPQVFWVRSSGETLKVRFGRQGQLHKADKIGNELFRVIYEPQAQPFEPLQIELHFNQMQTRVLAYTAPRVRPQKLRATPFGALAVSTETDELLVFGSQDMKRLRVGDGPVAAVATATHAWVAHRYDPRVLRLDVHSGVVTATQTLRRTQVDIAHFEGRVAVAVQSPPAVWVWRGLSEPIEIPLPAVPQRVFFGRNADEIIVASRRTRRLYRVTKSESGWKADATALVMGRPVSGAALSEDRGILEVVVSDYRPLDDAGPNHFVHPRRVSVSLESWSVRSVRKIGDTQDGLRVHGSGAASMSRSGSEFMTAFTGSAELHSPSTGFVRSPLHSPNGLVALPGATWLITSAVEGAAVWFDPKTQQVKSALDLRLDDTSQSQLRRGERAFNEATRSGTSCATCHPGQDSDYAWHNIGHGLPRPTLSVLGMAGTAPYLRGASYPTLGELNHFAETLLLGYDRSVPNRSEDLQAYMLSLPPPDVGARLDPQAVPVLRQGMKAFAKAGCDQCHSGPAFTDLAQYPTGLLFPQRSEAVLLDTPSLIGVSSTPPYLYDGRAADLRSIFEVHDPRGRHGAYALLDSGQQEDLLKMLGAL